MNDSLLFLYIVYIYAIFFFIISIIVSVSMVLPLVWKQAKVKNGLRKLRYQMLARQMLGVALSITFVFALTSRFFISGDLNRYIIVCMVLLSSLIILCKTLIDFVAYRQQFTAENISFHAKVEEQELKEKSIEEDKDRGDTT